MFTKIYNRSMNYFSKHPSLNAIAQAAAGFGLAVLLQGYLKGNAFVDAWVGWTLIAFSVIIHVRSFLKSDIV